MKRVPWLWLVASAAAGAAFTIWLADSVKQEPLARDFPQGELRTIHMNGDTVVSGPRFTLILKGSYSSQREDEKTTIRPYTRREDVLLPPSQADFLVINSFGATDAGFADFGFEPGYEVLSDGEIFTLYKGKCQYVREGRETVVAFAKGNAYQMICYIDEGDAELLEIVQYLHVY